MQDVLIYALASPEFGVAVRSALPYRHAIRAAAIISSPLLSYKTINTLRTR
jgi:hypothetical protein